MNQIYVFDNQEYVIIDQNFNILQASFSAGKYAAIPEEVKPDRDVRLPFPELIGLESILIAIGEKRQDSFLLNAIARQQSNEKVIYFDINIKEIEDKIFLFFKDVTEVMELRQSLVQKINEAELTLSTLKRFEHCTNRIISSMGDILFITNSSGIIERVNRAAENILGHRKSALLNNNLSLVITDEKFDFEEIYNSLMGKNTPLRKLEFNCLTKQKQQVSIEFNCFLVPTEVKEVWNCVYIGRDITVRKKAEQEMLIALEKEKELTQLKSRFISMTSHEFRNPLSSILISVEALSNYNNLNYPSDLEFYLKFIKNAALNMQSLLEDVLIISKTEAGKQSFKPIEFDLLQFIQQIIQEILLSFPKRKIDITVNGNCSLFYGDEQLLWHIFTNLLSNALKYSSQEKTVDLLLSHQVNLVSIVIRDRGIGIPLEAQKHLFESFYRANNVGDIPGTGLGLAIVKRAIDLHQGTITINSEPNLGTTVTIILPRIAHINK